MSDNAMDPKDKIIVFDLHGVVFTLDWRQVWHVIWRFPHKLRLIACGLNIPLAWHGLRLLFNNPTDVEVYALFNKYCPSVLPLVIDITNSHKPIPETVRVLQKLKSRGYTLHILSNIGPDRLKKLQERYPEVISLFYAMKINNGNPDSLIKKPQKAFYEAYLHEFDIEPGSVLFIDNNKSNIRQAQKMGFSVIRFKSSKQLLGQLCKLHII